MKTPNSKNRRWLRAAALGPLSAIWTLATVLAAPAAWALTADGGTARQRDSGKPVPISQLDEGPFAAISPSRRPAVSPSRIHHPGAPAVAQPPDSTLTLYLLGTTDVHGHLYPWDYYAAQPASYGLALIAPLVDSVRRAHPGDTYLFDSGDLLQGTPLTYLAARRDTAEPHPVVRAMNLMGYSASAVGNHEYNYGIPALDRALAQAKFPWVAANVFRRGTNEPAYRPYLLIPRVVSAGDTVLIGVTGITPPGVLVWDHANVQGKLDFRDPVASLRPVVAEMKARGADVVVVLNHGGFSGTAYDTLTTGVPPENAGARIAREIPGVDVIFLGHTHGEVRDSTINGVLLTQARAWARSLADVEVSLQRRGASDWHVVARKATLLRVDPARADTTLLNGLRWQHERAVAYVGSVLGRATAAMPAARARVEDTPLIDFVSEVQRRAAGADLSAASAFSLEAGIPAGPITLGQIAAIYPYENTLTAVRLTGAQLKAYLEKAAEYFRQWPLAAGESLVRRDMAGYNFDEVTGVQYTIDLTKSVGSRITRLTYRGKPVTPGRTFTLALNNYRQGGGGGFSMVAKAPVVYTTDRDVRDLLVEEVRARRVIRPADYFHANWTIVPAAAREQAAREMAPGMPRPTQPTAAAAKRLRVLTTNDLHGRLLPETYSWTRGRPVGGAATLAAYFRAERDGFAGPLMLLDAGDEMQGTPISNLTQGRSSVAFFDAVGTRAAAVGNHEFDWGQAVLRQRLQQAQHPWLAANIVVAGTDSAPSWVQATAMIDVQGVKVGLVGVSTPETPSATRVENVAGLEFRDAVAAIDRWVPELRRRGADFVIVIAHSGGACDSTGTTGCRGEIVDWASKVAQRPDLMVAGHTHRLMRTVVNGIAIVQAASYGQRYGVVDLERPADGSGQAHAWIRDVPVAWADRIKPDSAVAALVARYQREIGPRVDAYVATVAEPLNKSTGDYPLGRLMADAWRATTRAQVAFQNNGGVRADLKPGPVTWGKLYEVQPFENRLVVLTLRGERLRAAIEHALRGSDPDANVSGLRATYDPTRPVGGRLLSLALADGIPVLDTASYTVAMPDFLAGGGDGFAAFLSPVSRKDSGLVDLDALISYLKARKEPVRGPADARLVAVSSATAPAGASTNGPGPGPEKAAAASARGAGSAPTPGQSPANQAGAR